MRNIQTESVTLPLYTLFQSPALRAAFYRGERDTGMAFAIPAPKPPVLTGGALVTA